MGTTRPCGSNIGFDCRAGVNEHPSGTVRNFMGLQSRLAKVREAQVGNKLHNAAKAETMGCARACRRVFDSQPRGRSRSAVWCPAPAKMRSSHSISAMVRSMFMPLKFGCTCAKHTRIRERIVPCGIFYLLSLACRNSFLEASAFVLFRPCDLLLEHMSGSKRPVGIAQEFASQQDYVSLPRGDDVLGLFGCGNHAHGSS